jgi:hypothetical protein
MTVHQLSQRDGKPIRERSQEVGVDASLPKRPPTMPDFL